MFKINKNLFQHMINIHIFVFKLRLSHKCLIFSYEDSLKSSYFLDFIREHDLILKCEYVDEPSIEFSKLPGTGISLSAFCKLHFNHH